MGIWQLRLDGSEVPYELAAAQYGSASLTAAQRLILQEIALTGRIRPVDAGKIIHSFRDDHRSVDADNPYGCCRWASGDGVDALKRLARRGFVRHKKRGCWVPRDA